MDLRFRLLPLALAAAVMAAPAAADPMLRMFAVGQVGGNQPLVRPLAACLYGGGDIDRVAEVLSDLGVRREDHADMGATFLTFPGQPYAISFYMDGEICDVSSERIGTSEALSQLMVLGGAVGFASLDSECTGLRIVGVEAEVTSSGNDPVCFDDRTSTVRFTFEAAN